MAREEKYSVEQKKQLVRAYKEKTGDTGYLIATKVADWCNKTYNLSGELHGYDFRRPKEMREWFDKINENISFQIESEDGVVHVVTASLIDIDFAVRNSGNTNKLRSYLQQCNKRFGEVIDTNQRLARLLKQTKQERDRAVSDEKIIREENQKLVKEKKTLEKKKQKSIRMAEKEAADAKRTTKQLLDIIKEYVIDPAVTDHLVNDLKFLIPEDGDEVKVPDCVRALFHDGCTDSESMIAFDQKYPEVPYEDEEDEEPEDENGEEDGAPEVTVLSQEEAEMLRFLDEF